MVWQDRIPTGGDRRSARIGLLGGSFNPAHLGHQTIARRALVALGLDQVWLMVSPGNPLKPAEGMAPFAQRLASAASLADGHRLVATDIEARLGTRYTFDTLGKLQTRFPNVHFVWLTGADGFATLLKWKGWKRLLHRVPVAVMPRPGQNMRALRGAAAHYLAHARLPSRQARLLPGLSPPVWTFLPGRQNGISATSIRQRGGFRDGAGHAAAPDTSNSGEWS
ncbi:nicotinate-nucleotide adenylyltransferase [Acetobacter farinalis]|uniref:Probable nicotinate-nucleotide adenylyltransferase n=1 Tax=Acetobacter farinalis TaxID=1260984 RepID=A0ABT3Q896_9PROT|nr:nicotinate-nucleotide adenylyltransferase [Acetobacter farinalis]MCX2561504.1 nicotinate-nucleotide adenylyltransferase [Acetobacter farinalis]NHO30429.1 nicotinate-nucleotide adenylyltransferase [Acetobacter farinalis]